MSSSNQEKNSKRTAAKPDVKRLVLTIISLAFIFIGLSAISIGIAMRGIDSGGTRAIGFTALLVGVGFGIIVIPSKHKGKRKSHDERSYLIVGVLLIGFAVICAVAFYFASNHNAKLAYLREKQAVASQRLAHYKTTLNLLKDYPNPATPNEYFIVAVSAPSGGEIGTLTPTNIKKNWNPATNECALYMSSSIEQASKGNYTQAAVEADAAVSAAIRSGNPRLLKEAQKIANSLHTLAGH